MISVRDSDGINIREVLRQSPVADVPGAEKTLDECMRRSVAIKCGMVDGEVACMWGLIPPTLLSDQAYLWLLTTHVVDEHKFLFVRYSQRYVEKMLRVYPKIVGDVMIGNDRAVRWLKWLGAEFGEPQGQRIPFVIRKK